MYPIVTKTVGVFLEPGPNRMVSGERGGGMQVRVPLLRLRPVHAPSGSMYTAMSEVDIGIAGHIIGIEI